MTKRQRRYISIALTLVALLLLVVSATLFRQRQRKTVATLSDMHGAVVGVQLGTTADIAVSALEHDTLPAQVERYTKTADAVQALLQGKVDCVVVDEQPAKAFRAQNDGLRILSQTFSQDAYAMAVSKQRPELQSEINRALNKLRQAGTLDTIVQRHLRDNVPVAYTPRGGKKGTLVVATNATFRPYEYYDQGEIVGIDIDIVRAVADEMDMNVRVEDMEFDAVITSVETGKTDVGAAGLTVTPERQQNVAFSIPYATTRNVVLVADAVATSGDDVTIAQRFSANFLDGGRYAYLLQGLGNTVMITLVAMIISLLLGTLIAIVRTTHDTTGTLTLPNLVCRAFLMIIRGTPTMVQLLIIYYVVFASADVSKVVVAIVAFGINSSAYLAEVVRSGIMAVDKGQMEAGRSLGLTHTQTLRLIILPQAFKNVLPAMGNELITLLKETSICGYIGLTDLTKASDIIRSITYDAMMPLGLTALIYFSLVAALAYGVAHIEKRLSKQ